MSKVVPLVKRPKAALDKRAAQSLIHKIAEDSSNVGYTAHAREQMRRGINYAGMLTILREGVVADEPVLVDGRWRYRITFYKFKGNRDAACVVVIKPESKIKVITVMWIDL